MSPLPPSLLGGRLSLVALFLVLPMLVSAQTPTWFGRRMRPEAALASAGGSTGQTTMAASPAPTSTGTTTGLNGGSGNGTSTAARESTIVSDVNFFIGGDQLNVALYAILLWDWLSLLPSEVALLWRRPVTALKVSFFLARYVAIVEFSIVIPFSFSFTVLTPVDRCQAFVRVVPYLSALVVLSSIALLSLRAWALYDRSRGFLLIISALYLANGAIILAAGNFVEPLFFGTVRNYRGCVSQPTSTFFAAFYISPMVFETLIFVLTVRKSVETLRATESPLIKTLLKDNVLYYIAILTANGINLGFLFQSNTFTKSLLNDFSIITTTIFACRLTISLARAIEQHQATKLPAPVTGPHISISATPSSRRRKDFTFSLLPEGSEPRPSKLVKRLTIWRPPHSRSSLSATVASASAEEHDQPQRSSLSLQSLPTAKILARVRDVVTGLFFSNRITSVVDSARPKTSFRAIEDGTEFEAVDSESVREYKPYSLRNPDPAARHRPPEDGSVRSAPDRNRLSRPTPFSPHSFRSAPAGYSLRTRNQSGSLVPISLPTVTSGQSVRSGRSKQSGRGQPYSLRRQPSDTSSRTGG